MATKKTTKKVTTAKSAPKKAAAKATETTVTRNVSAPASRKKGRIDTSLPGNLINIILAEAIGTFVLTLVAISAASYFVLPLYVNYVSYKINIAEVHIILEAFLKKEYSV